MLRTYNMSSLLQLHVNSDVQTNIYPKVLVLYTGGAIGMRLNPDDPEGGLVPIKNKLKETCKNDPTLHDISYHASTDSNETDFMLLPEHELNLKRVLYFISEYDQLIDSSNVTPAHWKKIAKDIQMNYEDFDGFVILHGSDTMVYTASALSFMFDCLQKPIVLTGSMLSIYESRSDGRINMRNSILIAGNFNIPEVVIYFGNRLLRGNRTTRKNVDSFSNFDSFNLPPLLQVGAHVPSRLRSPPIKKCNVLVHHGLNTNISVLYIFPSIPHALIKACLDPPIKGVVLYTYGCGNIPSDRTDLIEAIANAVERGVIVVNCSQCITGSVSPIYATGKILEKAGVIFGSDLTIEAAITKLMYVLAKKKLTLEEKKKMLAENTKGEMTNIVNSRPTKCT